MMGLCQVNKLKFQEELLDKHIATLINNLNPSLDFDEFNFNGSYKDSEEERKSVKRGLISEVAEIQNYVMRLKQFRDRDPHHPASIPDDLNNAVVTLKQASTSALRELAETEEDYTRDLEIIEKKIAGFQKTTTSEKSFVREPPVKSKVTCGAHARQNEGVASEVREFQSFLEMSGGHTGGWDEQDHRLFLKHRLKLKGVCMAEALHILLPDISPEAIVEHDEWYKKYESLRAEQSRALQTWREGSRKETIATTTVEATDEKEVKVDPAVLKALAEKKRQQVREWKLKKQELQLAEENLKAKKLHEKCVEEFAKEEEREKQRLIVEEYKLKKAYLKEVELAEKARHEAEKQSTSNSNLRALFRERDRMHVARTVKRIQEAKQPAEDCVPKVPTVVAERDPERLLRPTKAWVRHTDQQDEDETSNTGVTCNYVNHLPHLKVPNWRKNM